MPKELARRAASANENVRLKVAPVPIAAACLADWNERLLARVARHG